MMNLKATRSLLLVPFLATTVLSALTDPSCISAETSGSMIKKVCWLPVNAAKAVGHAVLSAGKFVGNGAVAGIDGVASLGSKTACAAQQAVTFVASPVTNFVSNHDVAFKRVAVVAALTVAAGVAIKKYCAKNGTCSNCPFLNQFCGKKPKHA